MWIRRTHTHTHTTTVFVANLACWTLDQSIDITVLHLCICPSIPIYFNPLCYFKSTLDLEIQAFTCSNQEPGQLVQNHVFPPFKTSVAAFKLTTTLTIPLHLGYTHSLSSQSLLGCRPSRQPCSHQINQSGPPTCRRPLSYFETLLQPIDTEQCRQFSEALIY